MLAETPIDPPRNQPIMDSATELFIKTLFGNDRTTEAIEFRACPNERGATGVRAIFSRDPATITLHIQRTDKPGMGGFFGVCTRLVGISKGGRTNLARLPAWWLDIDCGKFGIPKSAVIAALKSCPIPPSIIVDSGTGIHAYWLAREAINVALDGDGVVLDSAAETEDRCIAVMKQLAGVFAGDLAVCELARIMRLPGTHNSKPATLEANGGEPALVTLIDCNDRSFELSDMEEWLELQRPLVERPMIDVTPGAEAALVNPFTAYAAAEGYKPPIDVEAMLAAMRYLGSDDSSVHQSQLKISASLIARGEADETVLAILMDATARAAGPLAACWNWRREERIIKQMIAGAHIKYDSAAKAEPKAEPKAGAGTSDARPSPDDAEPQADWPPGASNLPTIRIVPGELPRIVDEAEAALIAAEAEIYQRGPFVVTVARSIIKTRRGDVFGPRLMRVSEPLLVEMATTYANFVKHDGRSNKWRPVDCPDAVAKTLLTRPAWRLRPLVGLVEAPTLRWDGTVLDTPGYDPMSGLILLPGGPCPVIPERPSKDDAVKALAILGEPLAHFPFVGRADRAVALSGMLTALSRRAYQSAPLHAFTAPVAGSGKSKLVDLAAMIVSGRPAPVIAAGSSETELEKRIASILLAGDPLVSIDNVETPLGGELLCQTLTQGTVKPRILGVSLTPEVTPTVALYATGNNLSIKGDLTRRTLLAQLDPQCERPELRSFAFDPVAMVENDRARYIGAGLTILRAYIVADYPDAPQPLGSFEGWSNMVRGALLWLGEADPVATMEAVRESDPILADLRFLVAAWEGTIGLHVRVTAATLVDRATPPSTWSDQAHPELHEALISIAGSSDGRAISPRKLGRWLKDHVRRIVDGLRIVVAKEDAHNGAQYRLERAHEPPAGERQEPPAGEREEPSERPRF